jgi:hypothetical protein
MKMETWKARHTDISGNIARLQRSGRLNDGTYGLVDDLSMTYAGNRLTVHDEETYPVTDPRYTN